MYFTTLLVLGVAFAQLACSQEANGIPHGAQIRVTNAGLRYLAALESRLIQQKLTQIPIPDQHGNQGPIRFDATNIRISSLQVGGGTSIQTIPNVGLRFNVQVNKAVASTRVHIEFHQGWIKVGDTTTVTAIPSGVDFSLGIQMTASNGKPHVHVQNCRANIRGLDLRFSGGLGWLYNLLKGILIPRLKGVLQDQMCRVSTDLINGMGNQALSMFPTRLNILDMAYIDYSFQQSAFTGQFMDWLLKGEFLDFHHPTHSKLTPLDFDTASLSRDMAYVWVSDYTLNTLGEVIHNAKLLRKLFRPEDMLPPMIKQFLNTVTFQEIIPKLYELYPDRPMQIGLETTKAPHFKMNAGNGQLLSYARLNMKVVKKDKSVVKVFHFDIGCDTKGEASLKTVEGQLRICGKITSKKCSLTVGGSTIGDFKLPVDSKQLDEMINGLVINQINPLIGRGIPLPQSPQLVLKNPNLTLVKGAVRVGTAFEIRI